MMYDSTLKQCDLDNVDCPLCNNSGVITRTDENGCMWSRPCECMKQRVSKRRLKDSGLQDMIERYNFDSYKTPSVKYAQIKAKAIEFVNNPSAECYVIVGRSGSGKTHICTAICQWLIENNWAVKYMMWRTEAAELKAMINEREEYRKAINKLRNIPVLYIDDFFKGSISEADVNLAFTILNDRYNSTGKKTIISTERTIEQLIQIDEAIGGRIAERARGFIIQAPNENWRTK